jgi:hypothetical protein
MDGRWAFRCYVSARGKDEIREWYGHQSRRVQAKFFSRLKALRSMNRSDWRRPLFAQLFSECEGLWEIRFEADGVQHRPLGFFQGASGFTLLFCAQEKDSKFVPHSACETALARKAEILANRENSCVCWLSLD